MWPFNKRASKVPAEPKAENQARGGFFTTDGVGLLRKSSVGARLKMLQSSIRVLLAAPGEAMDSANSSALKDFLQNPGIPDAQLYWYSSQGFIGYQICAVIAQHWLVDKACSMPARDAIRQGYEVTVNNGEGADPAILDAIKQADKAYGINKQMRELIHFGRVFGIRVAIFKIDSTDPEYYQKPFNLDGVTKGSYRGISQVDPIWMTPVLTSGSLNDPASMRFYDPEFWMIQGVKYHRSHLCVFVPFPVTDILKPTYQFGGVSLPQRIYERVYAAERTANEAPQLAITKRTTVLKVNAAGFMADINKAIENLENWATLRDNYGVKVIDKDSEDANQFDTALGDLDATIMTQYQLVAAIANVPATKLLGTTPKGFNSTGEYEEASYREELESIQANDLTPFLERHHQLVMRSDIAPAMGIAPVETSVSWLPLDSPTAAEWATINKTKAETDAILAGVGAIDGIDIRKRITADKDSDHFGLAEIEEVTPEPGLENGSEETPALNEQA